MTTDADVEFFWDPVCPWAWLTSRWVGEVARQRQLTVDWRFISLRLVNAEKDYERDFPAGYVAVHGTGLKLLRVAAAVRDTSGREAIGDLYTTFGGDIHVRRRRNELVEHYEEGFPDYLRSVGLPDEIIAAANDDRWDRIVQADTDERAVANGQGPRHPHHQLPPRRCDELLLRPRDQPGPEGGRSPPAVGRDLGGRHVPRPVGAQAVAA